MKHREDFSRSTQLYVGQIIDALDYLNSWYLSIIVDQKMEGDERKFRVHFSPFNAKRDEWLGETETSRIDSPFTQSSTPQEEREAVITQLKEYLQKYEAGAVGGQKQKKGKQGNRPTSQQ